MVLSEEAGALFGSLRGRYSKDATADLDVYLKGYDGGPIRVDRITRPGATIDDPAITILVTPQPAILDRLAESPDLLGRGVLGRMCFVLPESLVGSRLYDNRKLNPEFRSAYARTEESLEVNAPSRNAGCEKRLVVAIGTTRPVSSSAFSNSATICSRSAHEASMGTRSLSWKLTP